MFLSHKLYEVGKTYTGQNKAKGLDIAFGLVQQANQSGKYTPFQLYEIWDFACRKLAKEKVDTFMRVGYLKSKVEEIIRKGGAAND